MWSDFDEKVLQQLSPIIATAGVSILVLIVLARVIALVPPFRDLKKGIWRYRTLHHVLWASGLAVVLVVPVAAIIRALWLMRDAGPQGQPPLEPDSLETPWALTIAFADAAGLWWIFLVVALVGVVLLGIGFATRRGTKITIKKEGSGLDATRIMATLDTMVGQRNRGLEYVVGTDVTKAAESVTTLSENKFAAMVQAIIKGILGSTPWELAVENESETAVSLAILRNGKVLRARRVSVTGHGDFADLGERTKGDNLAALVAGEFVATLADRYPSTFARGLYGARRGSSIGIHHVVTQGLNLGVLSSNDQKVASVLQHAASADLSNRAARTTLWNVTYRHATGTDLTRYAVLLDDAIRLELSLMRRAGSADPEGGAWIDLKRSALAVRKRELRQNELLLRLAQTRVAVGRNLLAEASRAGSAGGSPTVRRSGGSDESPRALLTYLLGLQRESEGLGLDRRRMLSEITEFRADTRADADVLEDLSARLKERGGGRVSPPASTAAVRRAWLEERILLTYGEFRSDSRICYSLACRRAVARQNPDHPSIMTIPELLRVALTERELYEWAGDDPELKAYQTDTPTKQQWASVMDEARQRHEPPAPRKKSMWALMRAALEKSAAPE